MATIKERFVQDMLKRIQASHPDSRIAASQHGPASFICKDARGLALAKLDANRAWSHCLHYGAEGTAKWIWAQLTRVSDAQEAAINAAISDGTLTERMVFCSPLKYCKDTAEDARNWDDEELAERICRRLEDGRLEFCVRERKDSKGRILLTCNAVGNDFVLFALGSMPLLKYRQMIDGGFSFEETVMEAENDMREIFEKN